MKKILTVFALIFAAVACSKPAATQSSALPTPAAAAYNYSHQLQVGSQTLMVEIAGTTAEQEQGLSGRPSMDENQGMLFEFPNEGDTAFWMKDMEFNLDFIWINQNKIAGITGNAPSPTSSGQTLLLYYPPSPVNQVLEVNAGWAEKNNVKVGDEVELEN